VEIRPDEVVAEHAAQGTENAVDLPLSATGRRSLTPSPYDAANPGWDPFVKRFR
jgi:hypothetical protein